MENKPFVYTFTFLVLLQIVFFFLKMFNKVTWSWLWILSPIWIPYSAVLFIGIIIVLYAHILNLKGRMNKHE